MAALLKQDGSFNIVELLAMLERSETDNTSADLFKMFDKDGDGFITKDELNQGMKDMGQELTKAELDALMTHCDTDRDGKIDFDEFCKNFGKEGGKDPRMANYAGQLTEEQSKKLEQFLKYDMDGDGKVTAQEIIDYHASIGVSLTEPQKQEQRDWVKSLDKDQDGAVSVEEFVAMLNSSGIPDSPEEIFKMFDKDGNGFISRDELKEGMKKMGQELTDAEVDEMIKSCDLDGDGRINYQEFLKSFG